MTLKSTPTIERQKAYVTSLNNSRFKYSLAVGTAFVRGMRDIGYKDTGTALDELIDNSYEAGASRVHVIVHEDGRNRRGNVSQIAVIDDGAGMIPDMIRVAMLWGGTDRENSRTGIGRFGYGLPSSCVSQGRRFEVYSIPEGGELYMCALDLDEIEAGHYNNAEGEIVIPEPGIATLPRFVQSYIEENLPEGKLTKGTVVVIDKLDRLTWKSMNALTNKFFEHFGVVYHKLRHHFELYVNGKRVEPIDPLFLTPGFRWFDLDADRAQAFDPLNIDVKDKETKTVIGRIHVRYSYMPLGFGSLDKNKPAAKGNTSPRFSILKDYNGIIVTRMDRVIDTIRITDFPDTRDNITFGNNDRYFKVEVNFDANLDEYFNVPTSKQRVDVSERVWEILGENGVAKAIKQLRSKYKEEKSTLDSEQDKEGAINRPSEQSMTETAKISRPLPPPVAEKIEEEGKKRLEQEVEKRVAETGKAPAEIRREIEAELAGKLYKVSKRNTGAGSAFFEVEQFGGTKVLWLNTASRFFQEVYASPSSTPAVRAALELLLFSIGDSKLGASDQVRALYDYEILEWSRKLEYALAHLSQTLVGQPTDPDV